MVKRVRLLIALLAIVAGPLALAQQSRDTVPTRPDSASIAGTVFARDTKIPIRGARVALTSSQLMQPRVVLTGDDGTFRFDGLSAGTYRMWAVRGGFIATSFGEKRPGSGLPGTQLVLTAAQRMEGLQFPLPRGGVISGQVLDASGEPVPGAMIMPIKIVTRDGKRTGIPAGFQETDDRGAYRIHGLAPGDYIIGAMTGIPGFSQAMTQVSHGEKSSHAPPQLFVDETTFGGQALTYHPSTPMISAADRIGLALSEERVGIDIRQSSSKGVRISGTVRDRNGLATSGEFPTMVMLIPGGTEFLPDFAGGHAMVQGGKFELTNVHPGSYELTVTRSTPQGDMSWAAQEVTVGGANLEGLELVLQPSITVSGSIEADSGPLPDIELLLFTPVSDSGSIRNVEMMGGGGGAIKAGQFESRGLRPGRYSLSLPLTSGWSIASATFGGVDVLDSFLEIKQGDNPTGRVVLTRSTTEISGNISGTRDPATNYFVAAVSADPRHWFPESRRNAVVEAEPSGRFAIPNLPAGRYRLIVLEDFDTLAGLDAELIPKLAAGATADVTLAAGARVSQDVRVK